MEKRYDREFKIEAVRLASEPGNTRYRSASGPWSRHSQSSSRIRIDNSFGSRGQYVCQGYREALKKHHFVQSMSRKGNCRDNAVAESFFGIFKSELIRLERLKGAQDTLRATFEYIAIYYNRKRKHSTFCYKLQPNSNRP
jgi:transposase InsO family protein